MLFQAHKSELERLLQEQRDLQSMQDRLEQLKEQLLSAELNSSSGAASLADAARLAAQSPLGVFTAGSQATAAAATAGTQVTPSLNPFLQPLAAPAPPSSAAPPAASSLGVGGPYLPLVPSSLAQLRTSTSSEPLAAGVPLTVAASQANAPRASMGVTFQVPEEADLVSPEAAIEDNDTIYDRMRRQRILREELRSERRTRGLQQRSASGAAARASTGSASDRRLNQLRALRSLTSTGSQVDAQSDGVLSTTQTLQSAGEMTQATWGGSTTVSNLDEAAEELENENENEIVSNTDELASGPLPWRSDRLSTTDNNFSASERSSGRPAGARPARNVPIAPFVPHRRPSFEATNSNLNELLAQVQNTVAMCATLAEGQTRLQRTVDRVLDTLATGSAPSPVRGDSSSKQAGAAASASDMAASADLSLVQRTQSQLLLTVSQCQQQMLNQQNELIRLREQVNTLEASAGGLRAAPSASPAAASASRQQQQRGTAASASASATRRSPVSPPLVSRESQLAVEREPDVLQAAAAASARANRGGDTREAVSAISEQTRLRSRRAPRGAAADAADSTTTDDEQMARGGPDESLSLFDAMKETIYAEVARFIARNENSPNFLLDLYAFTIKLLYTPYE